MEAEIEDEYNYIANNLKDKFEKFCIEKDIPSELKNKRSIQFSRNN